jgi:excisionase family DNA binding protein
MGEELFTPSEVAERLRVTREVVYKWLQSGKMKGIRVGRHWRVRGSDLNAFLQ